MKPFVLAPLALKDIEDILDWTNKHYGAQAQKKYELLLVEAIQNVADEPGLPGSHPVPGIGGNVWLYHLRHSRNRVRDKPARVKHPRHLLIYRANADGIVEIARVLHDSMDVQQHVP